MILGKITLLAAGVGVVQGVVAPQVARASASTTTARPNILFILADDLGLGDLSCQYAADIRTPNIDRIFATGVRNDRFMIMMDFLPTFCEMLGIPVAHGIDGISALGAISGRSGDTGARFVHWQRVEGGVQFGGKSQSAVRHNGYKLLQNRPFEPLQMFDIGNDPQEASALPLKGEQYRELMDAMTEHYRLSGAVPWQKPTRITPQKQIPSLPRQ